MSRLSAARILFAAVLAGAVASCETVPPPQLPPPPPPMLIQAPPPAPVLPQVNLSQRVVELASTYRAVAAATSGITPNFSNADDVAQALRVSASYEHGQFQQGAVAYAAIAALQDPAFVASMREFGSRRSAREQVFARLMANPNYVAEMPNVAGAAGLAISALDGTGARMHSAGQAIKQSAYDIQRQAWSRATVTNPTARLDLAKLLSGQRLTPGSEDVEMLRLATSGQAALSLSGEPVAGPYTPLIARALTIAAVAAMGLGGDENAAYLDALLADATALDCLNMAKLNFYQCLAVSGPHYEDIFCLGQHAMMDTGQCMVRNAGAPPPVGITAAPVTSGAPSGG